MESEIDNGMHIATLTLIEKLNHVAEDMKLKYKECCICKSKFIPTNKNGETRQCCKECIKDNNKE